MIYCYVHVQTPLKEPDARRCKCIGEHNALSLTALLVEWVDAYVGLSHLQYDQVQLMEAAIELAGMSRLCVRSQEIFTGYCCLGRPGALSLVPLSTRS
jgi:hypothetical protein